MRNFRAAHSKLSDGEYAKLRRAALEREEVLTRKALAEAARRAARFEPIESPPLPEGQYSLIYADPMKPKKGNIQTEGTTP